MTYSMGYVDTYRIVDEETMGMIDVKWNDMHFIFYRGFFGWHTSPKKGMSLFRFWTRKIFVM